jgi:hypothetical protein
MNILIDYMDNLLTLCYIYVCKWHCTAFKDDWSLSQGLDIVYISDEISYFFRYWFAILSQNQ